jgi:DNA-binding transcriptional regulator YiaG|tara:strand:- start:61 stop:261 length:201 start_codon:yes stop_codon:yes gene_type:complete
MSRNSEPKNPEFIALIEKHNLTSKQVSELLDLPFSTVDNWRRGKASKYAPKMSPTNLKLLKLTLDA